MMIITLETKINMVYYLYENELHTFPTQNYGKRVTRLNEAHDILNELEIPFDTVLKVVSETHLIDMNVTDIDNLIKSKH